MADDSDAELRLAPTAGGNSAPALPADARPMRRVVATFVFLALFYPIVAFGMRGIFGAGGAIAVGGVTSAAIVVLGAPGLVLFLRNGWLKWWHFALGGGMIGLLCTLPFAVGGGTLVAALAPAFLALGTVNGVLFWVLAVWRNGALAPAPNAPRTLP